MHFSHLKYDKSNAFTLIELLIAIALISILMLIAAPKIQHVVNQNRVIAGVNQIVAAINFARSEAIKRNEIVTFCPSADHKTCNGQWRDGQIVLAGENVLRIFQALPKQDSLTWRSSLGKNTMLQMSPTGFTAGQTGSFYYCPTDNRYAKRIIVEQTGRVRVVNVEAQHQRPCFF
jgi:type IV fimbrial biogenesis protein FimT